MLRRAKPQGAVVLDLDGILGLGDVAKELFDAHHTTAGVNLGDYFAERSSEIAQAFLEGRSYRGVPAYSGQTLEVVMKDALEFGMHISEAELVSIGRKSMLVPGASKLVATAKRVFGPQNVFIVTTTYGPAAREIARRVGIAPQNVYATELAVEKGFVKSVKGRVMGGINKANALSAISTRTGVPLSRFVAVGDSITDMDMIKKVKEAGGLAVAFDATPELLGLKPNVVVAARSVRPVAKAVRKFGRKGHAAVESYARANQFLNRVIPTFMRIARAPHVFHGGVGGAAGELMKAASAAKRKELRGRKIAKLRY